MASITRPLFFCWFCDSFILLFYHCCCCCCCLIWCRPFIHSFIFCSDWHNMLSEWVSEWRHTSYYWFLQVLKFFNLMCFLFILLFLLAKSLTLFLCSSSEFFFLWKNVFLLVCTVAPLSAFTSCQSVRKSFPCEFFPSQFALLCCHLRFVSLCFSQINLPVFPKVFLVTACLSFVSTFWKNLVTAICFCCLTDWLLLYTKLSARTLFCCCCCPAFNQYQFARFCQATTTTS